MPPYDVSGEDWGSAGSDMDLLGADAYYPPNVSGYYYPGDVSGFSIPLLNRVPLLNRLPGFRPNRPRRPPIGTPMRPAPMPPLPMAETRPNARLRSTLGLPSLTWGATDAGVFTSQVLLQESFRAERLVIGVANTGTPAGATRVVGLFVGAQVQSPAITSPQPVEMFASNATYAGIDWQIAHRGTQITVQMDRTAAPGTNNAVTATIGFYGVWIR